MYIPDGSYVASDWFINDRLELTLVRACTCAIPWYLPLKEMWLISDVYRNYQWHSPEVPFIVFFIDASYRIDWYMHWIVIWNKSNTLSYVQMYQYSSTRIWNSSQLESSEISGFLCMTFKLSATDGWKFSGIRRLLTIPLWVVTNSVILERGGWTGGFGRRAFLFSGLFPCPPRLVRLTFRIASGLLKYLFLIRLLWPGLFKGCYEQWSVAECYGFVSETFSTLGFNLPM